MGSARHTEKLMGSNKDTVSHYQWHPRCFVPHKALTRPLLSRFALHFARLNGHLDSGFLVRMDISGRAGCQSQAEQG